MRGRELQLGLIVGILVVAGLGGAVLWSSEAPPSPDREEDVASTDPSRGPTDGDTQDEESSVPEDRPDGGEHPASDGAPDEHVDEDEVEAASEPGTTREVGGPPSTPGEAGVSVAVADGDDPEEWPALRGQVQLRTGQPAGDFEVQVEGVPAARTTTEENGAFRIEDVPEGHHVVVAHRASDGAHGSTRVEVTERGGTHAMIQAGTAEGAIEGVVLHEGEPVAGATVVYTFTGGLNAWGDRQVTGPDGRYRFEALGSGGYRVEASDGEELVSERTSVDLAEGRTARVDIVLRKGASIEGTVVNPDGEPVEGHQVWVQPTRRESMAPTRTTAQTDAEGRFRIGGLREGTTYRVEARGSGEHLPGLVEEVTAPARGIRIELERGGFVVCRFPEMEEPPDDLSVRLEHEGGDPAAASVQRRPGAVHRLGPVDAGTYRVRADASGYATTRSGPVTVSRGAETAVELVLDEGATVSGRVLDPSGRTLEGARVFLYPEGDRQLARQVRRMISADRMREMDEGNRPGPVRSSPDSFRRMGVLTHEGETGPDGSFAVDAVGEGSWTALALHPRFVPGRVDVRVAGSGSGPTVDIRVARGASIAGRIVDEAGTPLPDGRIAVQGRGSGGGMMAVGPSSSTTVDDDGTFRLEGLEPGGYRVIWVQMEEGEGTSGPSTGMPMRMERRTVNLEEGEEKRVEIVVEEGITLSGRVLEAGEPVTGAVMQLFDPGGGGMPRTARTDGDGRFEVAGLHAGTWRLMVMAQGRPGAGAGRMVTVEVPDRPDVEMDIELPTSGLAGRVVGPDGQPVEGAEVLVLEAGEGGTRSMRDLVERMAGQSRTGADGTFTVEGVGRGPFQLQVTADGLAVALVEDVAPWREASPSDGQAVRVVMEAGVPVTVHVARPDGEGVGSAEVFLVNARTGELAFGPTNRTDDEGILEVHGVRPGRYHLHVYADGWAETRVLDRSIQGHDEIRVALEEAGALEVLCRDATGRPVDGATVSVHYPDGTEAYAIFDMEGLVGGARRTGDDGRIVRNGLAEEPYTVRVEGPDGRTGETTASVVAGETTSVEVTLR